ncbi:MAG: hypothetical protein A2186_00395 [Candidatus Levybacteria bacterium RIFOXYA1_FULL_41_10]|nr:MAG: hypothetical protein UT44_C0020G0010 [Candidatus Levybacteria bacterium GW2011_GWA1_39_32]KKR50907.1 MAG: hypothetical protein UT87_C0010G0009 [Candidatus Levybacteria bacterium GW2011_GWC1_40_19]KKR73170.1 MAG: hypothetical protein UU15_C0017G0009 [Candidatus Levybacteria bacterium GW2011_GWC2_40_7]KKR94059.1 MAG: hypothetical protein UU45_C0017G0008 [Candidatus Levybacteria bacterium GW2011_GWA2_41_15]KKS01180.1 MAG: hypothetical protein UU52_C0017G0008 [Candidatus Levybacteria bacter
MTSYGIQKTITGTFDEAVERVKGALAKEGFGILTEINVKDTLKKKLDIDYPNYQILGACHPQFAYQVLLKEQEIGLLLPCNVIVYENEEDKITVSAIRPTAAMQVVKNDDVAGIAKEVEQKLEQVIANL